MILMHKTELVVKSERGQIGNQYVGFFWGFFAAGVKKKRAEHASFQVMFRSKNVSPATQISYSQLIMQPTHVRLYDYDNILIPDYFHYKSKSIYLYQKKNIQLIKQPYVEVQRCNRLHQQAIKHEHILYLTHLYSSFIIYRFFHVRYLHFLSVDQCLLKIYTHEQLHCFRISDNASFYKYSSFLIISCFLERTMIELCA